MKRTNHLLIASTLALVGALKTEAVVMTTDLGTAPPPATIGSYAVSPFDPGSISGADGKAHITNGDGDLTSPPNFWLTWGQSYTGNVYTSHQSAPLTLILPPNVEAAYLYMEPDLFDRLVMTATDSSGASFTTVVNGFYGSHGVGFYESVPGSGYLTSITVSSTGAFAIGEFGISTPDSGNSSVLLGLGFAALALGRWILPKRCIA